MSSFFKLNDRCADLDFEGFYEILCSEVNWENFVYRPDQISRAMLFQRSQRDGGNKPLYKIKRKTISNVSFSKSKIQGLIFDDCTFKDCLFIYSNIVDCEFHDCNFINCNTYKISIQNTYIPPSSFKKCLNESEHQNIGVHLYQVVLRNAKTQDQPKHEAESRYQFERWRRFQKLYEFRKLKFSRKDNRVTKRKVVLLWQILKMWLGQHLFGYGIKVTAFIRTVTALFGAAWFLNFKYSSEFGLKISETEVAQFDFIEKSVATFYYTVVTFTTVGYGDITPSTWEGQLAASGQSVIGFLSFALLVSMFFRKIAP